MTTMLDKCAVAGDITQGIDRTGCWTCAITVIGGTSSTAVKLVTCDTVNGSYEDFKELISASAAETDQYKGFVVDLHGAKKYIKVTGAVMATAVFGDCDHDVKKIAITAGEVPSSADLEDNKAVTIDVSTYTSPVEVTPSEGKDGMKKATITVSNIPSVGALNLYTTELSIFEGTFVQNPEEPEVTNTLSFYAVASDGSLLSEISDIPNAEFLISAVGTYETSTVWRKDSSSQPPLALADGLTYEDDQSFALTDNTIIINSPYNSTPVTVTVTKATSASTYLGNYLLHASS